MHAELRVFYLDENERFREIPAETYRRFLSRADSRALAGLGGRMVRLAVVRLRQEGGDPPRVAAVAFRRCKVTPEGSLDPAFKEKRRRLKAELASIRPRRPVSPKVVDASRRFRERRFRDEFAWTPTVSMVQRLSALLEQRAAGVLASREIMYQILQLTATA